jgi:endonuclease IV
MNRDDIIRMAREAGFCDASQLELNVEWTCVGSEIEDFAALVAAAEREACIDDCHAEATAEGIAQRIIERIRARGDK